MDKIGLHSNQNPFSDLKVLDLSSILAGPLTASFFAELGASVLKIENKNSGGDATRQWKLASEDIHDPYSAYYHSANYGKVVELLDFKNAADLTKLEAYIKESDIVVSNFQKSVAEKYNLAPNQLIARFPDLIIAQLSAYSFDDPRPGYDLIMQGETGWISMTGSDKNNLAKLPVALIDVIASHQMKESILIALLKKSKFAKGSVIHISLYKSALSALANQATNYLMENHIAQPLGTLHPNIAPYGDQFHDSSGKLFLLAIGSDAQFLKLWESLNLPIEKMCIFDLNSDRLVKRAQLQLTLQEVFNDFTFEYLEELFTKQKLPLCEIKDLSKVLNTDEADEMIMSENIDGKVTIRMSQIAFSFM